MPVACHLASVLVLHWGFTENLGQWDEDIRFVGRAPAGTVFVTDRAVSVTLPGGEHRVLLEGGDDLPRGEGDLGFPTHFLLGADPGAWVRGARTYASVVLPGATEDADVRLTFLDGRLFGSQGREGRARELLGDFAAGGSTCLGGAYDDSAMDVAVRYDGTIVVAGTTTSSDFPVTSGSYDETYQAYDLFVSALSPGADGIVFSTFVGGSGIDLLTAVEVGPEEAITIHGSTWSADFPVTPGALRIILNGNGTTTQPDLFVLRLDETGSDLVFGTYLGGSGPETAGDIAVDSDGRVVVVGRTDSPDFPSVAGPVPAEHGTAILAEISSDGSTLTDTAFWGGSGSEVALAVAIDGEDDRIVGGWTTSLEFPVTPGALQETRAGQTNGFVLRYRRSMRQIVFSTYLGGGHFDTVTTVGVDHRDGSILVGGLALNPNGDGAFPTTDGALDTTIEGFSDAFVARLDADGTTLEAATFVGGDGEETPGRLVVREDGIVAMTGTTTSEAGFPTTEGSWARAHAGEGDAFVVVLDAGLSEALYGSYLGGSGLDDGIALAWTPIGDAVLAGTTASADFPTTAGTVQEGMAGATDAFVALLDGPEIPGDTGPDDTHSDGAPDEGHCGCATGGAGAPGAGLLVLLAALGRRAGRKARLLRSGSTAANVSLGRCRFGISPPFRAHSVRAPIPRRANGRTPS